MYTYKISFLLLSLLLPGLAHTEVLDLRTFLLKAKEHHPFFLNKDSHSVLNSEELRMYQASNPWKLGLKRTWNKISPLDSELDLESAKRFHTHQISLSKEVISSGTKLGIEISKQAIYHTDTPSLFGNSDQEHTTVSTLYIEQSLYKNAFGRGARLRRLALEQNTSVNQESLEESKNLALKDLSLMYGVWAENEAIASIYKDKCQQMQLTNRLLRKMSKVGLASEAQLQLSKAHLNTCLLEIEAYSQKKMDLQRELVGYFPKENSLDFSPSLEPPEPLRDTLTEADSRFSVQLAQQEKFYDLHISSLHEFKKPSLSFYLQLDHRSEGSSFQWKAFHKDPGFELGFLYEVSLGGTEEEALLQSSLAKRTLLQKEKEIALRKISQQTSLLSQGLKRNQKLLEQINHQIVSLDQYIRTTTKKFQQGKIGYLELFPLYEEKYDLLIQKILLKSRSFQLCVERFYLTHSFSRL